MWARKMPCHSTAQPIRERTGPRQGGNRFPGFRGSDITLCRVSGLHFLLRLELIIDNIFLGTDTS